MQQVLNGYAGDTHVVVYRNWKNNWAVLLDGIHHKVFKTGPLRSENTTVLSLQNGIEIIVPHDPEKRDAWVLNRESAKNATAVVI